MVDEVTKEINMPKIFSENDKQVLRKKLIEAGIKKLEHSRYKSISVEEVALEVGIAKGTFYNFFPSKELFFYEIMQYIKEENRKPLRELTENATIADIAECLFQRYMNVKTVYHYFTADEIKQIMRRLPEGDNENDSEEFAKLLCEQVGECKGKPETIVSMCHILGIAAANRSLIESSGYETAIRIYCETLAKYMVKGE